MFPTTHDTELPTEIWELIAGFCGQNGFKISMLCYASSLIMPECPVEQVKDEYYWKIACKTESVFCTNYVFNLLNPPRSARKNPRNLPENLMIMLLDQGSEAFIRRMLLTKNVMDVRSTRWLKKRHSHLVPIFNEFLGDPKQYETWSISPYFWLHQYTPLFSTSLLMSS